MSPPDAACVQPLGREALEERIGRAESAFERLDEAAFRDRINELGGVLLPCMGDLVPAPLAARYHRLMALHLLSVGNEPAAVLSMRAVRAADPGASLPSEWLSAEHPLRVAFEQDPVERDTRRVPEPRSGSLAFDGQGGRLRPAALPTLVQVFDDQGLAVETTYLGVRDPLPAYAAVPRTRRSLAVSGAASAVAAVGLLAGSGLARAALLDAAADPASPADRLDGMRATTNTLWVGGTSLLVVAGGLGAAAIAVGPR